MIYSKPKCEECAHRDHTRTGCFCKAFPDGEGIPTQFIEGGQTHSKKINGQTGDFVFTPV